MDDGFSARALLLHCMSMPGQLPRVFEACFVVSRSYYHSGDSDGTVEYEV